MLQGREGMEIFFAGRHRNLSEMEVPLEFHASMKDAQDIHGICGRIEAIGHLVMTIEQQPDLGIPVRFPEMTDPWKIREHLGPLPDLLDDPPCLERRILGDPSMDLLKVKQRFLSPPDQRHDRIFSRAS